MLLEPKFDDPARVADYGFFANERGKPVVLTGDDLADAIMSGVAPEGAPFAEWVPKLTEGSRFQPIHYSVTVLQYRCQLASKDLLVASEVKSILNEVAYENYGAGA